MSRKTFLTMRADWNRRGPYVPLWFRLQLKKLDKKFVLQFLPPRSERDPRGVDPGIYPHGVWDVCVRLPRSGMLHPRVVWSLADTEGNYSPPGPDTVRLLRAALYFQKVNRVEEIEEMMDQALVAAQKARAAEYKNNFMNAMQKCCSLKCTRQWNNRVYLRREGHGSVPGSVLPGSGSGTRRSTQLQPVS